VKREASDCKAEDSDLFPRYIWGKETVIVRVRKRNDPSFPRKFNLPFQRFKFSNSTALLSWQGVSIYPPTLLRRTGGTESSNLYSRWSFANKIEAHEFARNQYSNRQPYVTRGRISVDHQQHVIGNAEFAPSGW